MAEQCSDCGRSFDNTKGLKAHEWQTDCGGDRQYTDESVLRQLYKGEKLSLQEIADKYGVDHKTIDRWMDKHGIDKRSTQEAALLEPASFTHLNGYTIATNQHNGKTARVYIHRLAAVAWHGYDKVVGNHVHHKDGVKWNNTEENIELLTEEDHKSYHTSERQPELGKAGAEARWR